jgi:hypothetical protein
LMVPRFTAVCAGLMGGKAVAVTVVDAVAGL